MRTVGSGACLVRIFTVTADPMYFFKPSVLPVVHNSYK